MTGSDSYDQPDPSAILAPPPSAFESAPMDLGAETLMALPGVVMVGETLGPGGKPAYLIGLQNESFRAAIPASIAGRAVLIEIIGEVTPY